MKNYRTELRQVFEAAKVRSPTTFTWCGKRSPELPQRVRKVLTSATARDFLRHSLQHQLYSQFYTRGGTDPGPSPADRWLGSSHFLKELSRSNAGRGSWGIGWKVVSANENYCVVSKDGLTLTAEKTLCAADGAADLTPGLDIRFRTPKELLSISPGFYMALSDVPLDLANVTLVRFYWSICRAGAARLLSAITTRLNKTSVPFQFKVLSDPYLYPRCDAAVLYLAKNSINSLHHELSDVFVNIFALLHHSVPAFTKHLGRGLAVAEDPGNGESFGLNRCGLVAEAIVRAYERGLTSIEGQMQIAEECFEENGVSLERPYLNSGSIDDYDFSLPVLSVGRGPASSGMEMSNSEQQLYLLSAQQIGEKLIRTAFWHDGACNWLAPDYVSATKDRSAPATYSPLGPAIYSGSSGIALFLAELSVSCKAKGARETALGAMRHALQEATGLEPSSSFGLYTGLMGIALLADRIGSMLGDRKLRQTAVLLLEKFADEYERMSEFDVLSGRAGAILGIIALAKGKRRHWTVDLAEKIGDTLLDSAEKSKRGYSWRSANFPTDQNLTGLSHGAAGVALALIELGAVSEKARFSEAAGKAFEYETSWFDEKTGNWPDFREEAQLANSGDGPAFSYAWCHGAPGIALAHARVFQLTGDERRKADAIVAAHTTRASIANSISSDSGNYSLCHGLAGNALVLLEIERMLRLKDGASQVARKVGRNAALTARREEGLWRCGADGIEVPGLMLGLAGIGHFYLKICSLARLSALLLHAR